MTQNAGHAGRPPRSRRGLVALGVYLVVAVLVTAVITWALQRPRPPDIDVLAATAVFDGADCVTIGRQLGEALVRQTETVLAAPPSREESFSIRLTRLRWALVLQADVRLREIGEAADCDAETLLAAAEEAFDPAFRQLSAQHLYDFDVDAEPPPYADWRADLLALLQVVDRDEHGAS